MDKLKITGIIILITFILTLVGFGILSLVIVCDLIDNGINHRCLNTTYNTYWNIDNLKLAGENFVWESFGVIYSLLTTFGLSCSNVGSGRE